MDHTTILGVIGASIVLVAFLLNQAGKINAESKWYDALNAFGSLILVIYAVLLNSAPFVLLNVVWMAVSVTGLVKK